MAYAILDIETVPLTFADKEINEYLMDKNIKRYVHPLFSKIICIGIKLENKEANLFFGEDEKKILEEFWNLVNSEKPTLFVTWNGYGFDVAFINMRTLINGLQKKMEINTNRWRMNESNHLDCMLYLSADSNFSYVALDMAARILKIEVPSKRHSGADIKKLFENADWESIIEKNKQDLEILEEVFKKIKKI